LDVIAEWSDTIGSAFCSVDRHALTT